ncbi:MAG: glycosyltransferase [Cyanobacteria bacterium P01_F01_bin.86]
MVRASVVLPVFNGAETIQETVASVLSQTCEDLELIIINDGSTDNTLTILAKIRDARLKIFSFPNAGLSASRNRGLKLAQGEYISFIDADDLWAPPKLQSQLEAIAASEGAAVAYSWTDFIDESGQFLHAGIHSKVSGDLYERLFLSNFLESGSNVLIRRDALVEIGGFDETLKAAEDWDCFLKLARQHRFAVVPEAHVFYRQPTTSMSTNFIRQEQECLRVMERALQQSPERLEPLRSLSLSKLYLYLVTKALQPPLNRVKGWTAIRFLATATSANPALLTQRQKLLTILGVKAIVGLTVPTAFPWLQRRLSLK